MKFVNLYFQSEYSLLKSACSLRQTFPLIKKYQYDAIAITDEGSMYGTIKFYQQALEEKIKPIIGLKLVYQHQDLVSPILLYAMNNFGYRNLMKLSSKYLINQKQINLNEILNYTQGILVIVPFFESILYEYYRNKKIDLIFDHLNLLNSCFEEVYVGLSKQTSNENNCFQGVYELLKDTSKLVAIHKITFLEPTDEDVFQIIKSIENSSELVTLNEHEKKEYMLSNDEISMLFIGYEDLINATITIKNKCNVTIDFKNYYLPVYQENVNADIYLRELSFIGLQKRLKQNHITDVQVYLDRINKELDIISKMHFSDYFLIVWDFIKYAKTNKIYVGPGRGSAPASLVCYSLGISDVDPIKYNLLFERFLNPERITMPDIDTDFPDDKRDEVIKYVGKKYGINRVAHIATFGTFKAKLAIRDVARVLKLSNVKFNEISKCLNSYRQKDLYDKSLKEIVENSETLLRLMDDYDDINKVLSIAIKIEKMPRNVSTHAAGIVITKNALVYHTPLDNGLDEIYQTQYEAVDLEKLGLLKMDFLGLRNLTIIDETLKLILRDFPTFSLPKRFDDVSTFKMLQNGDVSGVFQLESNGMKKVLMDLKVSSFDDLTSAIALYRPGPMEIIPSFIRRKFGFEKVVYPHPDLENILKETYGTIVYQDQIMLIATRFAGYSLGKADVLRRAVSKKKLDVLTSERTNFIKSSMSLGYSQQTANDIYDYIVKFASYGFNKAHSVAYAMISYQTAFLKCHFTMYYLAALMNSVIGSDSDLSLYYQKILEKKIAYQAPNILVSDNYFMIRDKQIVFPITLVKGLGNAKAYEIINKRNEKQFKSFDDFIKRTKDILNDSLIENLIYSGCLDCFKITKKAMLDNYRIILNRLTYDFVNDYIPYTYDTNELSFKELAEKEKMTLGINIKYNFINQFLYLYEQYNLIKIADVKLYNQKGILGYIESIRIIDTKNKEKMAFIKIKDDLSSIDLTLFPTIYLNYQNLKVGDVIIVFGKTEQRNELQIIVNEIRKV